MVFYGFLNLDFSKSGVFYGFLNLGSSKSGAFYGFLNLALVLPYITLCQRKAAIFREIIDDRPRSHMEFGVLNMCLLLNMATYIIFLWEEILLFLLPFFKTQPYETIHYI